MPVIHVTTWMKIRLLRENKRLQTILYPVIRKKKKSSRIEIGLQLALEFSEKVLEFALGVNNETYNRI